MDLCRAEQVDTLETQIIRKVSCGKSHSVAVNDAGHLLTWGGNNHGQLGRGKMASASMLTPKYDLRIDLCKCISNIIR